MSKSVKALILAAGKGKRMKSELPKVLHPVRGKRIIDYVLSSVKKAGIDNISMVVGHKKECFEAFSAQGITLVEQKELLGTGHAIMQAEKECKNAQYIVVLAGDVPLITSKTLKTLVKKHIELKPSVTILTGIVDDSTGYGKIVKNRNNDVVKIVEDKDATAEEKTIKEINSGIYCFTRKDLFEALKKIKTNNKQNEYYLTDVVEICSNENKKIRTCSIKDFLEIKGINNRKDLSVVDNMVNGVIVEKLMDEGVTIIDPKTTFVGWDVKIGKDTQILPFTVIEESVRIGERCKIGPFSHIRKGTVLKDEVEIGNFVEIKKSTIDERTKAKHLSYIGDSILGKQVNIGAGTITANYDGKNKHKTIIEDEAFIGSNTKMIAPVKIGKKAITGAGAVVIKDVAPSSVVVGVPARKIR